MIIWIVKLISSISKVINWCHNKYTANHVFEPMLMGWGAFCIIENINEMEGTMKNELVNG